MYKTFAKHLLAIAFVIYLIAAVITALLALAGGTVGILLGTLVSVIAAFVLQATLVKAVQDIRDGQADMSIGQTVSSALPYLAPVAGASILAGIAITIGLLLIIVPGLFLITIWAVIVPVIIIEQSGALASFGRSRALVRGHGWHVFGTLVHGLHHHARGEHRPRPHLLRPAARARRRPELGHLGHPDLPVPRARCHARVLPARRHLRARGRRPVRRYAQPPQYGGYAQPPQYGGYAQPPQGSGDPYGGYQPPPQGGGWSQPPQGGWNQPPQGGSEPPTQQVPRWGGPEQPR